jgi:hypothetical protein
VFRAFRLHGDDGRTVYNVGEGGLSWTIVVSSSPHWTPENRSPCDDRSVDQMLTDTDEFMSRFAPGIQLLEVPQAAPQHQDL